jgi:hypothetical protein
MPREVAALYGKWSKDAASCATEYLLYQPDRSFLFDARTSLASGGTVYYDIVDDDLIAFDGSTGARYRRLGPDQIQQVSFFSTRTGPHQGGPTLVRCPDADPPDRVDWTPTSADRATAIALISEARAQFEAAEAAPGTTQTPSLCAGAGAPNANLAISNGPTGCKPRGAPSAAPRSAVSASTSSWEAASPSCSRAATPSSTTSSRMTRSSCPASARKAP